MTRRTQYLTGILLITPLWFGLSWDLLLRLAAAEDTMPLDLPVPLWVKLGSAITCPAQYILPDGFPGLSDHASAEMFMLVMLINSALWAFVIIFLLRLMARLLRAKNEMRQ